MAQGAGAATLQPVGSFNNPIYMTSPPGDPRLFVVERGGTIEVVHDGVQSQFLDIHDLTTEEGERGLLSMAFDPNYAKNGLFYVFYTGDRGRRWPERARPRRRVPRQLESQRRRRRQPPARS